MALSAKQLDLDELAGENVQSVVTHAPGNGAPMGGQGVPVQVGYKRAT